MDVKCFMLEITTNVEVSLRRYVPGGTSCSGQMKYHDGTNFIEIIHDSLQVQRQRELPPKDDPRWPTHCSCGYAFKDEDRWQVFTEHRWKRVDTGEEMTLRNAPPGAMWNATWFTEWDAFRGPDGKCIVVKCPPDGYEWIIDGRASNCTMPQDDKHKCWVRHGTPPNLTVDKNGLTCSAGGGSIQTPKWHGFLRNGFLVP